MRVFRTLFIASAVLLNSIEFSIQTNPPGSSPKPPPPAKGPPKPPPHPPQHQLPTPTKGATSSTPKPAEHPEHSHPAPQTSVTPHGGSSSANAHPAPGAPSSTSKKGSSSQPKTVPDLGQWPRVLIHMIPSNLIRLDANFPISGTTLDQLGFVRLTPHDFHEVILEFRKYTFFPAQGLSIHFIIRDNNPTPIPASEQIVIVDAKGFAYAILMPKGFVMGMYKGQAKIGRKKVNTLTNSVEDFVGNEIDIVSVGLRKVLPSNLYEMTKSATNSLLKSYGRKGNDGVTSQPPHVPSHDPPSPSRPSKRPRQNP